MKKIFALALFAVMAISASAQLNVGGTLNAWRNGTDHETRITIMPEVNYDLSEKAAIGTEIGWDHKHIPGVTTNLFGIAPYLRYNWLKAGKVTLFCDGGFNLFAGKATAKGSDTSTTYGIGFKPGVCFHVNEKFSLVAKFGFLGYQGANDAAKDAGYTEGWGFHFTGNNLQLGFFYTL